MTSLPTDAFEPPFVVLEPQGRRVPFVFNTPHAGNIYPEAFISGSRLDELTLRRSEDAFVDRLFRGMAGLGAPVLSARFPRAYLDVNREPYELEPRLFEGKLPSFANTRSPRVVGGLGTIPRVVAEGYEIYPGKIPVEEALTRIERLYWPFHAALRSLLDHTVAAFGYVVLIDCHSMPSVGLSPNEQQSRPEVVFGDRYGTSCAAPLIDMVDFFFASKGYTTDRNRPYAGGFITEYYGDPATGRHALQIELNRSLYMDEELIEPLKDFDNIARDLSTIFAQVIEVVSGGGYSRPLAAE